PYPLSPYAPLLLLLILLFSCSRAHLSLHSFPTRRSSDLLSSPFFTPSGSFVQQRAYFFFMQKKPPKEVSFSVFYNRSKSSAPCLHSGQIKSSGSSSPS